MFLINEGGALTCLLPADVMCWKMQGSTPVNRVVNR
jgi:hypothetical protein